MLIGLFLAIMLLSECKKAQQLPRLSGNPLGYLLGAEFDQQQLLIV